MAVLKLVLSLLVHHIYLSCLQLRFAVLSSSVYQLACFLDLLSLLGLMGATLSSHLVIQEVKFLTAWFKLDASSRWDVLRASAHRFSDALLQLHWGALGGSGEAGRAVMRK